MSLNIFDFVFLSPFWVKSCLLSGYVVDFGKLNLKITFERLSFLF